MKNKLLLDEQPLVILPSLAKELGLNEGIVIQQLHYWLQKSNHFIDGRVWVYNRWQDWEEQFPWWSNKTIRRTFTELEKEGLIISTDKYNKMGFDNTKWYTIDYDKLDTKLVTTPSGQYDQTSRSERPSASGQNDQANNQRLPETTSETKKHMSSQSSDESDFEKFYSLYPKKGDKKAAFEKFKQKIKTHGLDAIIEGTKRYATKCQGMDKQYIKLAKTFLHGECYLEQEEQGKKKMSKFDIEVARNKWIEEGNDPNDFRID